MQRATAFTAAALAFGSADAFVSPSQPASQAAAGQQFLAPTQPQPQQPASGLNLGGVASVATAALVTSAALSRRANRRSAAAPTVVPVSAASSGFVRDQLVACRAHSAEQADAQVSNLEGLAKQVMSTAASAVVFAGAMAPEAQAYPIFAQQNFENPVDPTGKLVCANCHLQTKEINLRLPHEVLPDTIFKIKVDLPLKYEKRRQLSGEGEKVELNAGAIVVLPEGWKLAPRDRLPKEIKKEMKGLAWSAYSKTRENIIVAGPVPGKTYSQMILPVLAPVPDGTEDKRFGKFDVSAGGNRGRGQVYPNGNLSNNNVFVAPAAGVVKSIESADDKKTIVTITTADGEDVTKELLAGADCVVEVGDKVTKDMQLSTNPNVGGFGQDERDIILQDMDRVNNVMALMASIFVAQLGFVLKKKQFEKVQLAEGF